MSAAVLAGVDQRSQARMRCLLQSVGNHPGLSILELVKGDYYGFTEAGRAPAGARSIDSAVVRARRRMYEVMEDLGLVHLVADRAGSVHPNDRAVYLSQGGHDELRRW